jgi:DNA-binding MarR family transcriptional regulator
VSRTPRLEEQLCFAIYSASRAFGRAYAPILEKLGLTYLQYAVLMVLWERDRISVRELGDRLALDSGTLTPLLKRLERAGIVTRERDTADERVVRIGLTAAGRKLEKKARDVPGALACRMGVDPSPRAVAEIAALRDEMQRLTRALDGASDGAPATSVRGATRRRAARRS